MTSTWEGNDLFEVRESAERGVRVVAVAGAIDLATVPELEATLPLNRSSDRVVLDLADCTFMDSSGLRFLLQRHLGLRNEGGRLLVVAPEGPVSRLIALAAAGLLDVVATRDAAFAALDGSA
jgi:anti-anti-sigma factor